MNICWSRAKARKIAKEKMGIATKRGKIVIHHKDGNPQNNNISNLEGMNQGDHIRLHRKGKKRTWKAGRKPWTFIKTNGEVMKDLVKEIAKFNNMDITLENENGKGKYHGNR